MRTQEIRCSHGIDPAYLSEPTGWTPIACQLDQITRCLSEICPGNLVGIYLHGSLALGCFNPQRSDLDLLVVTGQPCTPTQRRQLAQALLALSLAPCPVEISLVCYAQIHPWRYPPQYDWHFSEIWRVRTATALAGEDIAFWDAPTEDDPDLAAHITVARRRGLRLAGAPVAEALPVVPWRDYLDAILADVAWSAAQPSPDPVYLLLNLCRVWAAVEAALVLSKAEGAVWARPRLPAGPAAVVAAALAVYRGEESLQALAPSAVADAVTWLCARLPASARGAIV